MNNDERLRREFYVNPASYCRVMAVVSAVTFGLYRVEGGGTVGMLSVRWEKLGDEVIPRSCWIADSSVEWIRTGTD